jgi:hypothetical protein
MFFKRKERKDYTLEAEALLARFAARHGLHYVVGDAPVEVLWKFPVQPGLLHPIVLCLQNNDELTFGVGDFWSYMFPYPDVFAKFEMIIDAWVEGRARTEMRFGWFIHGPELQIRDGAVWKSIYRAGSHWGRRPLPQILMNTPD